MVKISRPESLKNFAEFLHCDEIVSVESQKWRKKKTEAEIIPLLERGLKDYAKIERKFWKTKTNLILGLVTKKQSDSNVILGPIGGPQNESEAAEFRSLWGRDFCQLRRFEDGSIRETIEIRNEFDTFFAAAIIQHLLRIHFREAGFSVSASKLPAERTGNLKRNKSRHRNLQSALDGLKGLLESASELPIRRIRGFGPAIHGGIDSISAYSAPKKIGKKLVDVRNKCSLLKDDVNMTPSLCKSVPVMLDVTHKKTMDSKTFSCLKTAYLINLKKQLESKGIPTMMKKKKLYVVHKGFIFSLDVDPPLNESESNYHDVQSMHNHLRTLSVRYPAWQGSCSLLRKWMDAQMLSTSIDDLAVDFLLASGFESKAAAAPNSVESALVRFFDLISFVDLKREPIVLSEVEPKVEAEVMRMMANERDSLPELVLITPFDKVHSYLTRNLHSADLLRLVNLCRKTLHLIVSRADLIVDWSQFELAMDCDLSVYDVVIRLKPLQIPKINEERSNNDPQEAGKPAAAFPVVDFDPVECYLDELRSCYGHVARFYYGFGGGVVGVKLQQLEASNSSSKMRGKMLDGRTGKLVFNLEAMISDFSLIGTGLVKSVDCNLSL